jgi:hypothetical protein
MKFVTKILAILGLLALLGGAVGLFFSGYLRNAAGQQNPAMRLAAATDKIATDPFAAGPSLGNVLIVILAIIGILAILVASGFSIYVLKTRQRYRDAGPRRQRSYRRPLARPQIASTPGVVGDTLHALVQLETARYLRGMQTDQERQPSAMLPPEQPIVVQQLGPDPVDDLLREL